MARSKKAVWIIAAAGAIFAIIGAAGFVQWKAARAIRDSAAAIEQQQEIRFKVLHLDRVVPADPGFETISSPASFYQAAIFRGKFYICGPAGLLEYDASGHLLNQYRVGHDLPASPLLRMAQGVLSDSQQPELLIATESEGVLAFNGKDFRMIRPDDPDARSLTSILPLETGQLLLGTKKLGVLAYDGKSIHVFHPTLAGLNVTALAGAGSNLWVGTLNEGVFHWQAGRTIHINQTSANANPSERPSEATLDNQSQRLPDSAVYSIALAQDKDKAKAYVGTALGIAELDHDRVTRVFRSATFAQTLYLDHKPDSDRLLAGSLDQGFLSISLESRLGFARTILQDASSKLELADAGAIEQIFGDPAGNDSTEDENIYALAQHGLYVLNKNKVSSNWKRVLSPENAQLADRNVSALAIDKAGRTWIGYFDHGLDIVEPGASRENSPEQKRVRHLESDELFCINRIVPNVTSGATAVATANGLVLFDAFGNQQQVLRRSDGLIADHVTDVAAYGHGMAVATPAGLTFLDSGGARSMYAFHGLVNNHVYSLAIAGDELLAGTLGGISVLRHEQVAANYTTATTGLKQNWISAIVRDGNGWMIGTYGSGVVRMNEDGRFESFDVGTGKFEVNPNAMLATERHVFAGSLGQGLYSYNRQSGRWTAIQDGLPSLNVTALAGSQGYLYVGTANGLVRIPEQSLP